MCSNYKQLEISDNLPNFGEMVLEEEIALLAPHFAKRVIGHLDDGGNSHNQGSTLRPRLDRKAS